MIKRSLLFMIFFWFCHNHLVALPLALVFTSQKVCQGYEHQKPLVHSFFTAFEKNDQIALEKLLASGYQAEFISDLHRASHSKASQEHDLVHRMNLFHKALSSMAINVEDIIANDERIVTQVTITGIQKGDFFGIAPTNRFVTIRLVSLFTVQGGKIIRIKEMMNEYQLMKQLGFFAL